MSNEIFVHLLGSSPLIQGLILLPGLLFAAVSSTSLEHQPNNGTRDSSPTPGLQYVYRNLKRPTFHLPGPWFSKWTSIVTTYHWLSGQKPSYVHALHQKYGFSSFPLSCSLM